LKYEFLLDQRFHGDFFKVNFILSEVRPQVVRPENFCNVHEMVVAIVTVEEWLSSEYLSKALFPPLVLRN